jgi:hypothetical protein
MRHDCFIDKMPRKSLIQKGEKCKGGKVSKERLSVLFCCSATGEKLKPLVIGNAAHPRVFKEQWIDAKHLPVDRSSNKKAWMTQAIFEEWLEDLNHVTTKQNQKILLLVDNTTSHCVTKMMSNVKVKFLPPDVTFEVQPLDQRIIRAEKS